MVSFTSHGAMVDVPMPGGGELHCYIPLTAMGTPPPTKARQVMKKGEVRSFVLAGLDPPRRVAELAIRPSARADQEAPQEPTLPKKAAPVAKKAPSTRKAPSTKKAAAKKAAAPAKKAAAKKAPKKKVAAKKAAKAKKAPAKKAPAKKSPAKKAGKTRAQ